jgi:hypothetical protein
VPWPFATGRIFAADRRFRGTADTKASSVRAEARIRLSLEAVRSH